MLSLFESDSKDTYYVCELSSYQLEDIQYSPHISVLVNLFPEHMDHHGDVDRYKKAKMNIVSHAAKTDYLIYNPKYPELKDLSEHTLAKPVPILEKLPFGDSIVPLLGEHNILNVRAAVTVASLLDIPKNQIQKAVKNFHPLPHRIEYIGTYKKIRFYDDAISTTPESAIEAIKSIPNISTILLGGQNRGYDFSTLIDVIISYKIPNIVLFPDSGSVIYEGLRKRDVVGKHILSTKSMDEAVRFAYSHSPKGSACVLSCASPSYSLWKNFEEKGDQFQHCVRLLGH